MGDKINQCKINQSPIRDKQKNTEKYIRVILNFVTYNTYINTNEKQKIYKPKFLPYRQFLDNPTKIKKDIEVINVNMHIEKNNGQAAGEPAVGEAHKDTQNFAW